MKKIYQQVLDLPQMVNQKILNAQLNTAVEKFDSQDGVRCYTKSIYQILSLVVFFTMEVAVIKAAIEYFKDTSKINTGVGMAGSVLTTLLLVYSAFPIAHIIKSRGESLGGSHNGILTFIFKDFITTNIKILGEVAAVLAFIGASCFTLSFLFDTNLFIALSGLDFNELGKITALPMQGLGFFFDFLKLEDLNGVLNTFTEFSMSASQSFTGDMSWEPSDLLLVAGGFINVVVGLVLLYFNLAIYLFLYTMVSNFMKWIQSPSIPISISMKSK